MHKSKALLILILILILCLPTIVLSFWQEDGIMLTNATNTSDPCVMLPDDDGGIWVIYTDFYNSCIVRVQHFDADGQKLLGENGMGVYPDTYYEQRNELFGAVRTEDGGILVAFSSTLLHPLGYDAVHVQEITPDGQRVYEPLGIRAVIEDDDINYVYITSLERVCPDGYGGMWILYSVPFAGLRVGGINYDGTLKNGGNPSTFLPDANSQFSPSIVEDGNHGYYFVYQVESGSTEAAYAYHVFEDGSPDENTPVMLIDDSDNRRLRPTPDGQGGIWTQSGDSWAVFQHMSSDYELLFDTTGLLSLGAGNIAYTWTPQVLEDNSYLTVFNASYGGRVPLHYLRIFPDGSVNHIEEEMLGYPYNPYALGSQSDPCHWVNGDTLTAFRSVVGGIPGELVIRHLLMHKINIESGEDMWNDTTHYVDLEHFDFFRRTFGAAASNGGGYMLAQILDYSEQHYELILSRMLPTGNMANGALNAVEESITNLPSEFSITTYPNPFNSEVVIKIENLITEKILLKFFNINGRLVDEMSSQDMQSKGQFAWRPPQKLSSGIYFLTVSTENSIIATKKLLFLR